MISKETRAKMRSANLGKKHTPEARAKIGIGQQGEKSHFAKLTRCQVVEILGLFFEEDSAPKVIASQFGVSVSCVYAIAAGESWKEVYKEYHANKSNT